MHIVHNGRRCRDRTVVLMQSVPITTNVVSSNPVHGGMYSILYYAIKFVGDFLQVGGLLYLLRFSFINKTHLHNIAEI